MLLVTLRCQAMLNFPIQGVTGTGAGGRIVSRDVAAVQAVSPATAAGPYEHIELSNMRKVGGVLSILVFC